MFSGARGDNLQPMHTPSNIPLQYIHTDIPEGLTIREWRRARRSRETRSRLDRVLGLHGLSSRMS
jgi:hypothetical protein